MWTHGTAEQNGIDRCRTKTKKRRKDFLTRFFSPFFFTFTLPHSLPRFRQEHNAYRQNGIGLNKNENTNNEPKWNSLFMTNTFYFIYCILHSYTYGQRGSISSNTHRCVHRSINKPVVVYVPMNGEDFYVWKCFLFIDSICQSAVFSKRIANVCKPGTVYARFLHITNMLNALSSDKGYLAAICRL